MEFLKVPCDCIFCKLYNVLFQILKEAVKGDIKGNNVADVKAGFELAFEALQVARPTTRTCLEPENSKNTL